MVREKPSRIVDLAFAGITKALQNGARLDVRGFGSCQVRDTGRLGRAEPPGAGETLLIPARKVAVFKPSK